MIVIADTTPLISLLKIEKLDLLEKLFGKVYIPTSVYQELTANPSFKSEATNIEIVQSIEILRNSGRHIKNELYEELLREAEKYR